MQPLFFHLRVDNVKDPYASEQGLRQLFSQYGQVLFVEKQEAENWTVQMRYPLDALHAMDAIHDGRHQVPEEKKLHQMNVTMHYRPTTALWFGNLPWIKDNAGGKLSLLQNWLVGLMTANLGCPPFGVYVSPTLRWAVVYIPHGAESQILELNNTVPSLSDEFQDLLILNKPIRVNLWNCRSETRHQGLQIHQMSKDSVGRWSQKQWSFRFLPIGKNVLQLARGGSRYILPPARSFRQPLNKKRRSRNRRQLNRSQNRAALQDTPLLETPRNGPFQILQRGQNLEQHKEHIMDGQSLEQQKEDVDTVNITQQMQELALEDK